MIQQQMIRRRSREGVVTLTLNNPSKRNALSTETLLELRDLFADFERDDEVRVVVLRSEGPVFSSGHDLRELIDRDEASYTEVFALCTEVMEAIRLLPKPVIAQVQGLATAAGCQLVATCDLAVAGESASFCTPGVQIGLFCTTPGVALARSVPSTKKAMEMLLTGEPVPASEALEMGLVNRVTPDDDLEDTVERLARQIASASAQTLAIGKPAFYRQIELPRPDAYDLAQKVMVDNLLKEDAHEGISAFLEKRTPQWNH